MTTPKKQGLGDLVLLAHVAILGAAIALVANLAGCQKKADAPAVVQAPTELMISAMKDYCKIGEMPKDKQREAMKLWAWHHSGNTEMGPLWTRAAAKKDPAAVATIRAAADAAVGKGNCPLIAYLGQ